MTAGLDRVVNIEWKLSLLCHHLYTSPELEGTRWGGHDRGRVVSHPDGEPLQLCDWFDLAGFEQDLFEYNNLSHGNRLLNSFGLPIWFKLINLNFEGEVNDYNLFPGDLGQNSCIDYVIKSCIIESTHSMSY